MSSQDMIRSGYRFRSRRNKCSRWLLNKREPHRRSPTKVTRRRCFVWVGIRMFRRMLNKRWELRFNGLQMQVKEKGNKI